MIDDLVNTATLDEQIAALRGLVYYGPETAERLNGRRSLLLLSIPKCGTTWVRYLLANYAEQLREPGAKPVTYGDLSSYWDEREFAMRGKWESAASYSAFPDHGIDHLIFQHPHRRRLNSNVWMHAGPKLLQYRNPLDFLVSCYFFYFEYRDERRNEVDSIRDIIPAYTRYYALCYAFLRDIVQPAGRAHMLSYEQLRLNGREAMGETLEFLGIPIDDDALSNALEFSTPQRARQHEEERGRSLVARLDRGSFVRDGSIGQWKHMLDDEMVTEVASILEKHDIPLDSFTLEG